jgi:HK97 family phage portal protein
MNIVDKFLHLFIKQNNKPIEKDITPSQVMEGIKNGTLYVLGSTSHGDLISKNYVVYRGVNLIAQTMAQVPVKIYRGEQPLIDGRLPNGFDFFNPNINMSIQELIYTSAFYYVYRGEYLNRIELLDGSNTNVLALYPINPKLMKEHTDGDEIDYWEYGKSYGKQRIENEQVIFIPQLNPDGFRGLGPIDVIKNEIITDINATNYNKLFFENFGRVGNILKDTEGNISAEQLNKLIDQFNNAHQGVGNSHKTLGLPKGIEYEELQQTLREMEFLQSRKDIRDRILNVLGIPKGVFGISDDVNLANALTHDKVFWSKTIKPNLLRIQNKYNQQLFNRYFPGYAMYFDFSQIEETFEDYKVKAETAKLFIDMGYTTNEVNKRFDLGMPEIEGPAGELRLKPASMIPVDDYLIPVSDSKDIDIITTKTTTDVIEKSSRSFIRKYNMLQREVEKKFNSKLKRYFNNQLGKVQSVINGTKDINKTDILINIKVLLDEEKDIVGKSLLSVYEDGSEKASIIAQEAVNVRAVSRVNREVVDGMVNKIKGINDHTYNLIRSQVVEAIDAGETIDQLSKRITDVYKFNQSRARTISRTETGGLLNRSTYEEYKQVGVKKKQWVGGNRPSHASINGQIKNMNENFDNGLAYPHDPSGPASEVINCTCTLVAIIE